MKDIIVIRIEELIQEINDLLEHREKLSSQISNIGNEISAKKGAIFELKKLLELKDYEER